MPDAKWMRRAWVSFKQILISLSLHAFLIDSLQYLCLFPPPTPQCFIWVCAHIWGHSMLAEQLIVACQTGLVLLYPRKFKYRWTLGWILIKESNKISNMKENIELYDFDFKLYGIYLVTPSLLHVFMHLSEYCICPSFRHLQITYCRAYFFICLLQYSHTELRFLILWIYASFDNQYLQLDNSFLYLSVYTHFFLCCVIVCKADDLFSLTVHAKRGLKLPTHPPHTLLSTHNSWRFWHRASDPPPSDITNVPHCTLQWATPK